jgi:DnaJ-class molecular chaperone
MNDKLVICPNCDGDGKRYIQRWVVTALNAYLGRKDDSETYPESVTCKQCNGSGFVPCDSKGEVIK